MILANSNTLLEDIEAAKQNGYNYEFLYLFGKIVCRKTKAAFSAQDVTLDEYHIHEALSDPSDQSIIFLLSTKTGLKGIVTGAYGIYSDNEQIEFFLSLANR